MPNYPENSRQQPMFTRHPFGEPKWQLQSQSEFDGLAPSQIVRYLNAGDRGFEDSEVQSRLAARLDATPDADNYVTNPASEGEAKGVTVDAHRYVVDPIVDNDHHKYVGLYTGGPVRTTNEPSREGGFHKRCTQVLTRTFCAGHGYWVDEAGRYHAAWPDGNGGWTGRNPDVTQVVFKRPSEAASEDTDAPPEGAVIREYMTADDALKAHRPWLDSKLSPYMALHPEAFPNTFVREVYWREFTHESIAALEELGSDRARLEAVVAYHFTEKVAPQVLDAHCRLDPQTNTVIFVCSLMYVELGEPKSPDDLLDLPFYGERCTRETLRMFGWNQLRDGEGYRYTHIFKWPRLKDTQEVRSVLEFVQDNKEVEAAYKKDEQGNYVLDGSGNRILLHSYSPSWILALLAKHDRDEHPGWASYENADHGVRIQSGDQNGGAPLEGEGEGEGSSSAEPGHTEEADNTGRLVTYTDTPEAVERDGINLDPAKTQFYRIAQQHVQVEQDGSLSFSIALARTEWHGADDGENYEDGGQRQLAGVSNPDGWAPSETRVIPSIPRENAIPTMTGIAEASGRIVTSKRQTEGGDGSSDVSFQSEPVFDYSTNTPEGVQNILANADATAQSFSPFPRPVYSLTYEQVQRDKVNKVIQKAKGVLGADDTSVSIQYIRAGYYTVTVRGSGKEVKHLEEWVVEADWFHHKTVEHWLGVRICQKGGNGSDKNAIGFYEGSTWHPIESISGDLDANWMASDPQKWGQQPADPGRHVTLENGVLPNGAVFSTYSHNDDHVPDTGTSAWTSSGWVDPDYGNGNGGGASVSEQSTTVESVTTTTYSLTASAHAGDADDKKRSHVLTSVTPHVNEDGTYNISITRVYPHQRRWEWQSMEMNEDGDMRIIYHVSYRNWPSRKAIMTDLFDSFLKKFVPSSGVSQQSAGISEEANSKSWFFGSDWIRNHAHNSVYEDAGEASEDADGEDGWSLTGTPSINDFGLVDALGITWTPSWNMDDPDKKHVRRSGRNEKTWTETTFEVESTDRKPSGASTDYPADGKWYQAVVSTVLCGYHHKHSRAKKDFDDPVMPGSFIRATHVPGKGTMWEWRAIQQPAAKGWKDTYAAAVASAQADMQQGGNN